MMYEKFIELANSLWMLDSRDEDDPITATLGLLNIHSDKVSVDLLNHVIECIEATPYGHCDIRSEAVLYWLGAARVELAADNHIEDCLTADKEEEGFW